MRHKFFIRFQKEDESVDSFVAVLNKMSFECEFENLREDLVKDILIVGLKNSQVKERLLREEGLTLSKAISFCKTVEITSDRMKCFENGESKTESVNFVQKRNFGSFRKSTKTKKNSSCFRCGEIGHWANRCRHGAGGHQSNRKTVNVCDRQDNDDTGSISDAECIDTNYFVASLGSKSKNSDWYETLRVNDFSFKGKIDTVLKRTFCL